MAIINLNSKVTFVKPDDYIGVAISGFIKEIRDDRKFNKQDLVIEDENQCTYVFRLNGNLARGCGIAKDNNGNYYFSPVPALGGRTTQGYWVTIIPQGKAQAKATKQSFNSFDVKIDTDKYLDFGTLGKPNVFDEDDF